MFAISAVTALSFALPTAFAATTTVSILIDADNNLATGCSVPTANGAFAGVDRVLNTTVVADATGYRTQSITLQSCVGGSLGAAQTIDSSALPIARGNGVGGTTAVETFVPNSFLPTAGQPMRVGVTTLGANGLTGSDALTLNGLGPILVEGPPLLIVPTLATASLVLTALLIAGSLWFARRRGWHGMQLVAVMVFALSLSGGLIAAIVRDGLIADWTGIAPAAVDPAGDAPPGSDITNLYSTVENGNVFFRVDVLLNSPPVANAQTVTAIVGTPLAITLTGSDYEASPLTFTVVTQPTQGVLTGTAPNLTYTPNALAVASDSFTFKVNDGSVDSALATVTIGNTRAPAITSANNTLFIPTQANTFAFASNGIPTPTASFGACTPALPSVSFTANSSGGGTLSGSPTVAEAGVHTCTFTSTNGVLPNATQTFTLTVGGAPTITSVATLSVPELAAFTHTITTSSVLPITGMTSVGALPTGATFTYAGTPAATATIAGTPAVCSRGAYPVTLGVSNSVASTTQSFNLTVRPVNQVPSFTKGADVTVLEDAAAQTVAGWATARNPGAPCESTQTLSFEIVSNSNPALFSAAPAVNGSNGDLTFTPAANANGTATLTVRVKDNGGTADGGVDTSLAQSFIINVTAVNDAPSFVKGADVTVPQNVAAQTVTPWATAISTGPADEAAQTVTFQVVNNSNPAMFSAGPAISPTGTLTFTPAANQPGIATLTVNLKDSGGTANGGVDTSASQTFTITVTAVNQVPSFTKGSDQTSLEDAGAQTVNAWATAISPGPASEAAQTVTFQMLSNSNAALFSAAPAVSPAGVLTYTAAANVCGTAAIGLNIKDNGGTANGGVDTSATQTFNITVTCVNDAPVFVKGADVAVLQNAPAQTVANWATGIGPGGGADEVGQTVAFQIVSNTNAAMFSAGPAISPTGTLTFTPATNQPGVATITINLKDNGGTANGGVDTSANQTFIITVSAVNQAPSFTKGADQTVFEDAGAQTVTPWATAISAGPANESAQTLTFQITNNTNAALFSAGPAVSAAGVLTFTTAANANGTATITLNLKDSGGTANGGVDTSATQTFVINVTPVNDAPSFVKGADQLVNNSAGLVTVAGWATAISAGPADEAGQTVSFSITGNTNAALFSVLPAVASNGTLTFTPNPASTGGAATITLTAQDNGGTLNGGADTSPPQTFVIGVRAAPVVTTNPLSQTVTAGSPVTFTAAATGTPTPTVQWQLSTDGGANYADIAGATSTTLTFTAAFAQNGNRFRAVFNNSVGTATSTGATLTVNVGPVVTQNPANQTVIAGSNASFTAAASGNPVPTVQWQLSTNGGATFADIGGATSTTLTISNATIPQSGNQYRAVFTNITGVATTTAATLTVNPGPATHFTVTAPASAVSGTPISVTVTALDALNNIATGYVGTAHFTSTDGAAALPADYVFTAGDAGSKAFPATLQTAGVQTVTATDTVTAVITGVSGSITVGAGGATHFSVSAPATTVAGVALSFTVTALDAANNTVTGYVGTAHFTSNDPAAVLPGDYTFTAGDNGVKVGLSATLKTAGARSITATDTVTASITGSRSITVTAAGATNFLVTAPATATSGTPFNITVTARDAFGNTATAYAGTAHVTSSDGIALLPPDFTLTAGVATRAVTLRTAGAQTVTATDTVTASITGTASTTVSPGAATQFVVVAPAGATSAVAFNFTVTARDAANNTATGYVGTAQFTSTDGAATLPANYTFTLGDSGVRTFSATLVTSGSRTITATDTVTAAITGTSNAIAVSAGSVITSFGPATFLVGTNSSYSITTSGTPTATSITLTGCTLPNGLLFTYGGASTATISGNATVGGSVTCTVTATNGVGPAATQSLVVTANQAPAISVASNQSFTIGAAGSAITFTVSGFPAPTLALSGCTLPLNLILTGNQISGTAAAGAVTANGCIVTASNGIGSPAATPAFTITVNQAPSITSGNATTFTVGTNGSFSVTASGTPAPTFSTVSALPGGVLLSAAGLLSGTPGAGSGGTYPITIVANNGVVPNASQAFTLTVNQAPTISAISNSSFTIGTPGSGSFTVTGFPTPTLALSGCTLPLNLLLTGNQINGTAAVGATTVNGCIVTATNAAGSQATAPFTITVVIPPPVVTTSGGTTAFTEDGPAVIVDGGVTTSSTGTTTLASATISISGGFQAGQDLLVFVNTANITGNYVAPTLTLTGVDTIANYQTALRSITYNNSSQNPNTASRTVSFVVNNGSSNSAAATKTVSVAAVNDAPVVTTSVGTTAYLENGVPLAIDTGLTVSDIDSATLTGATIQITGGYANPQDLLSFTNIGTITGSAFVAATGTLTLSGTDTVANYQVALRTVKYSNSSDNPSAANRTISFQVNDGGAVNNLSNFATKLVSVTPVNDAPVATAPATFATVPNIPITLPAGSLTGTDVDGPSLAVDTVASGVLSGAVVTLGADGSFTFTPPPGVTGAITGFQFRVCDTAPTPLCSAYQNVNFTVAASPIIYFVKSPAVGTANCTLGNECLLTAAVTGIGANTNRTIFISDANSHSANVVMNNGGILFGQAVTGASFDAVTGLVPPGTGTLATRPAIAQAAPTVTSAATTLTLNSVGAAGTNTVRGITLTSSGGTALSGTGFGTLTASDMTISGGLPAISLTTGTANVTFGGVSSTGGANGINLTTIAGTLNLGTGALSGATSAAFNVSGGTATINYAGSIAAGAGVRSVAVASKTSGTATFSGAVSGTGTGISLTSNTGATINFTGGINLSTGANAAFTATGGGTISATQNNTSTVNTLTTTTATALNVANTTIGASGLTFRSISSSGATNGIIVNTTGTSGGLTITGNGGACTSVITCTGGSIQSSTSDGVVLTSTQSPSLTRLIVTDSAGGATDDGIVMTNITGTVTIDNSAIINSPHNAITVDNFNTNMAGFNFTNSIISCATGQPCQPSGIIGNDGLLLVMRGTSVLPSGVVSGSTFSGVRAVGVQIQTNDSGRIGVNSGTPGTFALTTGNSFVVQNNTFTGNGQGIDMGTSQVSNMTFQVLNNTIVGKLTSPGAIANTASSHAINAFTAAGLDTGTATHSFVGKIDGNIIGTQGVKDSGSGFGAGIRVVVQGRATQGGVTVSTNTIREVPNSTVIVILGQRGENAAGTTAAKFKIVNNTMTAYTGSNLDVCGLGANTPCPENGISFLADQATAVCNVITGNTMFDLSTSATAGYGIYLAERVGPPVGAQLTVEGTAVNVLTHINNNNTLAGPNKSVDEGAPGNPSSLVAVGACGTFP